MQTLHVEESAYFWIWNILYLLPRWEYLLQEKLNFPFPKTFFLCSNLLTCYHQKSRGPWGEVSLKSEFSLHKIFVYLDYNVIVRRRWKVSIATSVKLTFTSAKLKFCQPTARIYVL